MIKSIKKYVANKWISLILLVHSILMLVKEHTFLSPRLEVLYGYINGQDTLRTKAGFVYQYAYPRIRSKTIQEILSKEFLSGHLLSRQECMEIHRVNVIAEHISDYFYSLNSPKQARIVAAAIVKYESSHRKFDEDGISWIAHLVLRRFKMEHLKQINTQKVIYFIMSIFVLMCNGFREQKLLSDYELESAIFLCMFTFTDGVAFHDGDRKGRTNFFYNINPYIKRTTENLLRNHGQLLAQIDDRGHVFVQIENVEQGRLRLGYIPPALAAAPAPMPLGVAPQVNQDDQDDQDNDAQHLRAPLRYNHRGPRRIDSQSIKSKNKVERSRHKMPVKKGRTASRWG